MKTYPAMNEQIVDLLEMAGDENPMAMYAAARIKELEADFKWCVQKLRGTERRLSATKAAHTRTKKRINTFFMDKIIKDLEAKNARLTAELEACRQQAFDTGREVGEQTAGFGELEY